MRQSGAGDESVLLAVADAAVIFAPVHFTGIGGEVGAGDLVVDADFRATQAREVAFREVGRRAVVAVGDGMIDALRDVAGVELRRRKLRIALRSLCPFGSTLIWLG